MHTWWLGDNISTLYLVGSFGATAVLIYAAPRAELSQPRNVVGGHIISALVGVSVYQFLPFDLSLLSAIAVSFAIMAMQLTKTVHPPGGATALISVIGSSDVHQLGYWFVLFPIATGAVTMLLIALVINNLSKDPTRHYPSCWF